MLCWRHFN